MKSLDVISKLRRNVLFIVAHLFSEDSSSKEGYEGLFIQAKMATGAFYWKFSRLQCSSLRKLKPKPECHPYLLQYSFLKNHTNKQ
nr:MAG TPA: hypothetical protein [Caudoviricetes sp.]